MEQLPLIVILGQTASGKTSLAVELGPRVGAEVVNADSRQIYRGMDIGTAKPNVAELAAVPHHLLDIVDVDEPFSLGEYLELAHTAIAGIRDRGRVPMLVGGSGQYVWAVVEGWEVPRVTPDPALRADLTERARLQGAEALHSELVAVDPVAAQAIHPNNVRRVVRALELLALTGQRPSDLRARRRPGSNAIILGIDIDRVELYRRIDARVDDMFRRGLVDEVQGLLDAGYAPALPALSGIGYTQVVQLLRGELGRDETIARVKTATHRLARQQSTWFRASDQRISWLAPDNLAGAITIIERSLGRSGSVTTGVVV